MACVDNGVGTPHSSADAVESEIYGPLLPEGPIGRAEAHLRRTAQDNTGFRLRVQKILVIEGRDIQAESVKVVGYENVAMLLRNGGFVESRGECQAESERTQVV